MQAFITVFPVNSLGSEKLQIKEELHQKRKGRVMKTRERIYVCHTFYHVYITVLKECNQKPEHRGKATLVLSTMSNDFGDLKERAQKSGLFEEVIEFHEKEESFFPQLAKHRVDRGNILLNMYHRILFTKKLGKLQEPYIPVDFKQYGDIYVYCDSDPIGYYLSYKKIYYHALEDGLNCIMHYDTARYDNRGHFDLKAKFSEWNLIFIQNGYGKYCLDMEVNNISCLKYPCPKYIEVPREELVEGIKEEDKLIIISVFMKDTKTLLEQIDSEEKKDKVLILSEPLCDLETRKKIFKDIVKEYGHNAVVYIKPHPRDHLDYKKLFPDEVVIEGKFPMEVMNFIPGIRWNKVISVITVTDAITCAEEVVFLGRDFLDKYEEPSIHRQNEYI